jgi:hypothetical protein
MRFHLPAYLLADLNGTLCQDVVFHLTHSASEAMSRFSILSHSQCIAVKEFLRLQLSDPNCDFERPMIDKSLREYWNARCES